MHEDLVRLAEVDRLDRELRRVGRAADAARKEISDHEQGVVEAQAHLATLEAARKASKTSLHQAERRAKRYRDRRASANKVLQSGVGDFSAAERQLTECARILDEVETVILEQMEQLEDLDAQIVAAGQAIVDAEAALADKQRTIPPQLEQLGSERGDLQGARDAVFDELDREFQTRYDRLVARKKFAVGHIIKDACSACQRVLPPQQKTDLKRGRIEACRGCHRWLVLDA